METAALIWALQKLPHFLDNSKMTVYTDHTAIVDTFKDNGPIMLKLSNRLANWRLFLSKYQDRMEIIHRPGKSHVNADGLSRMTREIPLHSDTFEPSSQRLLVPKNGPVQVQYVQTSRDNASFPRDKSSVQVRYVDAYPVQTRKSAAKNQDQPEPVHESSTPQPLLDINEPSPPSEEDFIQLEPPPPEEPAEPQDAISTERPEDCDISVSTLHIDPELLKSIAKYLPRDPSFNKVYGELTKIYERTKNDPDGPSTTLHCFRRDQKSKLLFFRDSGREKLGIPRKCFQPLFQMAHDNIAHIGTDLRHFTRACLFP